MVCQLQLSSCFIFYTLIEHALSINDSARCIRQKKLEVKVIRCGLTSAAIFALSGTDCFFLRDSSQFWFRMVNYLSITTFLSVF